MSNTLRKQPWLNVRRPEYFDEVLRSMAHVAVNDLRDEAVVVRFGRGVCPNYQVEAPSGDIFTNARRHPSV